MSRGDAAARATTPALCRHCRIPLRPGPRRGSPFCCFGCRLAAELAQPAAGDAGGATTLLLRLGLGIFLAINIMVFSWLSYAEEIFGHAWERGGIYGDLASLFDYVLLFLCTVVVATLGMPLVADALEARRPTTDLVILAGVGGAFALSVLHTLRGAGSLYYDTAAMILVLVTLGRFLEALARRRATDAATALLVELPGNVHVRRDGEEEAVASEQVRVGDVVRVGAGDALPVDGTVESGASLVDESQLNGESHPRAVAAGDRLLAGSVNLDGLLWVVAEQVGEDRAVAHMERLLERARREQPPVQRIADRIAGIFVPAVLVLAVILFGLHFSRGDAACGLFVSLSVLLISCPCALGLAAPLASWHALRRAAEAGILVDSAASLERAARVERLCFDKTGTLTEAQLSVEHITTAPETTTAEALRLAAGLETATAHPIARAVLAAAAAHGVRPAEVDAVRTLPGLGLQGRIGARTLRLGDERLLAELHGPQPLPAEAAAGATSPPETTTSIVLTDDRRLLARFDLGERLRDDAPSALHELHRLGIATRVLTGDRLGPARRVADRLGIGVEHRLLPAQKLRRLVASRRRLPHASVAAVGDGINDAPLLAAADVGIAVASAADLAKVSGNILLTADRLDRIPLALRIARHTRRRIVATLAWSFAFNAVGITFAAFGRLDPIVAAIAMVLSSLTVVLLCRGAGRVSEVAPAAAAAEGQRRAPLPVTPAAAVAVRR